MKKLILILFLFPLNIYAADLQVNEDELFSGTDTVVENKFQDNSLNDTKGQRSIGISGKINSALLYANADKSSENSMVNDDRVTPYIIGDLYFDARLPMGTKAFGSFELLHDASNDETDNSDKQTLCSLKEFFVDFNFNRYIYFRTGKQVLQWGQCYLWNPTDMMNIENKSFLEKLEAREGTYGIKSHIPFGTAVNIYGFADMNRVDQWNDIAGAGKFEFLVKDTEMAFSIWGKKYFHPVYGYDFSGRFLSIDIKGEASFSKGSNKKKIVKENGILYTQKDESDIYKASLNIGRDFDFSEKSDRINISFEMFYNGDGYSENPVEDKNLYLYHEPVVLETGENVYTIPGGNMSTYLIGNRLYEPNYFSKYYAAVFFTFKEFIISDITLMLNGISNIQQKSFILSTSLSYADINDFTAGLTLNVYTGDKYGEYRAVTGLDYDVQVTAGILF